MRRGSIVAAALLCLVGVAAKGGEMLSQINRDGLGNPNNIGIVYMETHAGRLYAGTWNRVDGCLVYVSEDEETWNPVIEPGFGASSFTTQLGSKGTTIWRTGGQGDGIFSDWEQVNEDGFGNVGYDSTLAMEVVGDTLYVGGFGNHGFLFATEDGTTWRETTARGFLETSQFGIHALGELNGDFYIGIQNWTKPWELWVHREVE